ncbi:hypothetical protein SKAU_G00043150 [Synaphobranchus kaupii]|uniref:Uncharacterized protein n=1 Tax=Synaphobranchus kaupii TaxID=118154 RepID=A0A9Q1G1P3_SYNKA|nr:hypothetical protein SKAU_G00043150 [Synaphobranchus kaupii]
MSRREMGAAVRDLTLRELLDMEEEVNMEEEGEEPHQTKATPPTSWHPCRVLGLKSPVKGLITLIIIWILFIIALTILNRWSWSTERTEVQNSSNQNQKEEPWTFRSKRVCGGFSSEAEEVVHINWRRANLQRARIRHHYTTPEGRRDEASAAKLRRCEGVFVKVQYSHPQRHAHADACGFPSVRLWAGPRHVRPTRRRDVPPVLSGCYTSCGLLVLGVDRRVCEHRGNLFSREPLLTPTTPSSLYYIILTAAGVVGEEVVTSQAHVSDMLPRPQGTGIMKEWPGPSVSPWSLEQHGDLKHNPHMPAPPPQSYSHPQQQPGDCLSEGTAGQRTGYRDL